MLAPRPEAMMPAMAKIVVGVDGSLGAQEALRWALGEARLRGAAVHVVHAWMLPLIEALPEPWVVGMTPPGPSVEEVYERLRGSAKDDLDSFVRAARAEEPDVEIEGELVEGRAAPELLGAASDADLLVVGTRGRGGFAGLLLGSVSLQCAHHSPCPLVIVPPPDER
jgi:nucleotide-binding universal stress UspA family protein